MMKLMIASDLHGSGYYCKKVLEHFKASGAQKLILLGDLLYHGPRNDLPKGYDPKEVTGLLNEIKEQLICVRGNCDAEVDQMVLQFPILADYAVMFLEGRTAYLTHGHLYGEDNPLPMAQGSILISGHTHVCGFWEKDGCLFINPGSVALPKGKELQSFLIYEDGKFTIFDMQANILMEHEL